MRWSVPFLAMSAAVVVFACEERFPKQIVPATVPATDANLEPSPPPLVPAAQRRAVSSSNVAFDRLRGTAWVANGDVGSVTEVDLDAGKARAEVTLGGELSSVCIAPDGAFVALSDQITGDVVLLHPDTHEIAGRIAAGTRPRGCVFDTTDPRWLYVATEEGIAVVDRTQGKRTSVVPAGRLPTGLAMTRGARTLVVSHRIDAKVSLLDMSKAAPTVTDVALSDSPRTDPKVPNGRPYAFEGVAIAPDDATVWLPHQLLSSTNPFQFQSVIFPSVSLVDLGDGAEIVTDDSSGLIAGRKNLFQAINVLEPTGDAMVFSQPCAAALHPNGDVAYVLACGSEDLLTFDVARGIVTSALRQIPGDHPSGIALDATGARALVYASESHELSIIDTRAGSLVDAPRVFGSAIKTVQKDPVDPTLRLGKTLFFRASSRKGDLAITGNNWMSCAACHLDGFRQSNSVFFEALSPDAATNAGRGHTGLRDLFATVPAYAAPTGFDPHDVLSAIAEQGGLAPDRLGQDRTGSVDPSAPTDAARSMAKALAAVIAQDLPLGPSWLLQGTSKYDPAYDGAWCGNCHKPEYAAWQKSVHSHAGDDRMVGFCSRNESAEVGTASFGRLCEGCHSPTEVGTGAVAGNRGRGVTCRSCHDATALTHAGGNADIVLGAKIDWQQDHKTAGKASLALLREPAFCAGCHQQFVPGTGLIGIDTYGEFLRSPYAGKTACVDCHMGRTNGVADHAALGGNVYLATTDPAALDVLRRRLSGSVTLVATRAADGSVTVKARNATVGHSFPTGVVDLKETWMEVQAVDAQKNVVARYGSPLTAPLAPVPGRLGMDINNEDGVALQYHELVKARSIRFERRIPAQGTLEVLLPAPAALPAGATELDAVLYYRNIKGFYAATAGGSEPPLFEMARTKVE
jgi:DNA-binding beta-propeller fold protein YncE